MHSMPEIFGLFDASTFSVGRNPSVRINVVTRRATCAAIRAEFTPLHGITGSSLHLGVRLNQEQRSWSYHTSPSGHTSARTARDSVVLQTPLSQLRERAVHHPSKSKLMSSVYVPRSLTILPPSRSMSRPIQSVPKPRDPSFHVPKARLP